MSDPTFVGPAPRDMPLQFPVVAPQPPPPPPPPLYQSWARADAQGEIMAWGRGLVVDTPADAVLGEASPATHYVDGGQLVAYTAGQAAVKALRPSFVHRWDNASMAWVDTRQAAEIAAQLAAGVRAQRDALLAASDFTQLADAPVAKGPWVAYRQALRDLTKQPGFPDSVTWPAPPAVSAG